MNELLVAAFGLAVLDEPRRTQPPNQLAPGHGNIITQRQVCGFEGASGLCSSLQLQSTVYFAPARAPDPWCETALRHGVQGAAESRREALRQCGLNSVTDRED